MRLFFLSIVFISIISCSKFEEGPDFSIRTKKARITNNWVLKKEYIFYNNQEYQYTQNTTGNFNWLGIEKDGSYFNNSGMIPASAGKWHLETKKYKDVFIGTDFDEKKIMLVFEGSASYIIHRLSSKELILEYPGISKYYFEAQ